MKANNHYFRCPVDVRNRISLSVLERVLEGASKLRNPKSFSCETRVLRNNYISRTLETIKIFPDSCSS